MKATLLIKYTQYLKAVSNVSGTITQVTNIKLSTKSD